MSNSQRTGTLKLGIHTLFLLEHMQINIYPQFMYFIEQLIFELCRILNFREEKGREENGNQGTSIFKESNWEPQVKVVYCHQRSRLQYYEVLIEQ